MKWRILKDEAVGAGNFTDTGEVFDDGAEGWDTYDPAVLQAHLAALGPEYGASWIAPEPE
jgi:hypothetical protein